MFLSVFNQEGMFPSGMFFISERVAASNREEEKVKGHGGRDVALEIAFSCSLRILVAPLFYE
jgi:hypothetical protein